MTINRKQWCTYLIGYFTGDPLTKISKIYSPQNKRYQMLHYEETNQNKYCWRYRADMILSTDGQTDKVKPVYPPSLKRGYKQYWNCVFVSCYVPNDIQTSFRSSLTQYMLNTLKYYQFLKIFFYKLLKSDCPQIIQEVNTCSTFFFLFVSPKKCDPCSTSATSYWRTDMKSWLCERRSGYVTSYRNWPRYGLRWSGLCWHSRHSTSAVPGVAAQTMITQTIWVVNFYSTTKMKQCTTINPATIMTMSRHAETPWLTTSLWWWKCP